MHRILNALGESGTFSEYQTDNGDEPVYVPARDIHSLTVSGILNALDHRGVDDMPIMKSPEWERLDEIRHRIQDTAINSGEDMLLKDL